LRFYKPCRLALAKTLKERFGKIDILVNNAGIALDFAPDMTTAEKLMGTFDVNVAGTARLTDHMVALLEKSDHVRIVNVSSALASFGLRHDPRWMYKDIKMPTYAASKAALNAMIVSYAEELAEKGIKIHGVCPGLTATEATGYQGRPVEEAIAVIIKFA